MGFKVIQVRNSNQIIAEKYKILVAEASENKVVPEVVFYNGVWNEQSFVEKARFLMATEGSSNAVIGIIKD